MKKQKTPKRMCVVTREVFDKKDLIRVVRTPSNDVIIDDSKNGKQNGRGAYLKKDKEVIVKAKQSKILEKQLNVIIRDEIYYEMLKKL